MPSRSARAWHGRVWVLAGPIILSNLSVPLVGAVDTAVVGRLPDPTYIGAVAFGAIVFSFMYNAFNFLRMGTTGIVAQAFGGDDAGEVRASLWRAVVLALGLGTLLVALQIPIRWTAFLALGGSESVESLAREYFGLRIWSAPAALVNFAVLGFLIAAQRTRAALGVQLVLNGLNVVLDVVLVIGLDQGVRGVALATVVSEIVAAGLGVWIAARVLSGLGIPRATKDLLAGPALRRLWSVNANIFVRTVCLGAAFFSFTSVGATLGEVTLAANAVLLHFFGFLAYGLDGFAHAAEALAGRAYGARRLDEFRAAVRASSLWALVVAGGYTAVYAALGPWLVALLTTIPEVRGAAAQYLPWLVVAPLVSVWSFQLDGIFIGTTRTREMRNAMLLSLLAFAAFAAVLVPAAGNHGLWLALTLFMAARGSTLAVVYPRIERELE